MYLLMSALVSGNALAIEPIANFGGCGTKPPPCLGILTGDFTIVPPDLYNVAARRLDGELNWFRVEIFVAQGDFDIELGGYLLDEKSYVAAESTPDTSVYYVPASATAAFFVTSYARETPVIELTLYGAEKSAL